MLEEFTFLPAFWRDACESMIEQLDPTRRQQYEQDNLSVLRLVAERLLPDLPDGAPNPFRQLSNLLIESSTFEDAAQRLNVKPLAEAPPLQWLFWSMQLEMLPLPSAYCAAAQLLIPLSFSDYPEDLRGVSHVLLMKGLHLIGPSDAAAQIGEAFLGLHPPDYASGESMVAALSRSEKLPELEANNRAVYLQSVADALGFVPGRGRVHSARLLESYLGLSEVGYASGESMVAALSRSEKLPELEANNRATYLRSVADALRAVPGRGSVHSARLLESYLGLSEVDYASGESMVAALSRSEKLPELEANNRATYLRSVADALRAVPGRGSVHSARLLESYLGLSEVDYASGESMVAALSRSEKLPELEANNRAVYLQSVADALGFVPGRGRVHSARLLESYLGLSEVGYASGESMVAALSRSEKLPELEANNRATYLRSVADALRAVPGRGSVHSARLLESYLGLSEVDYASGESMVAALSRSEKLPELEANNRATYLRSVADALRAVPGRGSVHSARLLESYLGLSEVDYASGESMVAALSRSEKLPELEANNRAVYLQSVADALGFVPGRGRVHSARLLESYLGVPMFEFTKSAVLWDVEILNRLAFVQSYLRCADATDEATFASCRAVMEYVQGIREELLPTFEQRRAFLAEAKKIWVQLKQLTLGYAEHLLTRDRRRAERIHRELLAWAEQFQNRILLERLFARPPRLAGEGADSMPGWQPNQWALLAANYDADGMSQRQEVWSWSTCLADCSTVTASDVDKQTADEPRSLDLPREIRAKLLQNDGNLEQLIPQQTVWIRALFDDDGRLWWWAHRIDQSGQLECLATKVSEQGAERALKLANLHFDLQVEQIWLAYEGRSFFESEEQRILLEELVRLSQQTQQLPFETIGQFQQLADAVVGVLQAGFQYAPLWTQAGMALLRQLVKVLTGETEADGNQLSWLIRDFSSGIEMLDQPRGATD